MLSKLQNDTFIFSGLRTHAQLLEASSLLIDENGQIRNFSSFANEFNKLNERYNQQYLDAEYQFAINSSQMAANWAALDENGRYNLQYRTANDDRVRDSHAALHNITLPVNDEFWLYYYPPNGWRCRCNAVEVLKSKYELYDSEKALAAGEKATTQIGPDGKNRLEIFRFNPGAENKVFPPKHPYNKLKDAGVVKDVLNPNVPENITEYEEKLKLNINKSFFEFVTKPTPLYFTEPDYLTKQTGAYYQPDYNFVKIPFDERRKRSKWYAEAVVYHEFGHASDWHNNLKEKKEVKEVMEKYHDKLDFKKIDKKIDDIGWWAFRRDRHDLVEKVGACRDTIMALNLDYGAGHALSYFKKPGNREAEFLAHAFENKFAGNDVFKKYMPELYEDMIKMIDEIKPKQDQK